MKKSLSVKILQWLSLILSIPLIIIGLFVIILPASFGSIPLYPWPTIFGIVLLTLGVSFASFWIGVSVYNNKILDFISRVHLFLLILPFLPSLFGIIFFGLPALFKPTIGDIEGGPSAFVGILMFAGIFLLLLFPVIILNLFLFLFIRLQLKKIRS